MFIRNKSPDNQLRGIYYIGVMVYDWQLKDIYNGGSYWYHFASEEEGSALSEQWKRC